MSASWIRIGNSLLSVFAGTASFVLTLLGFLLLGSLDQQIVASLFIGLFALLVVHIATERPNTRHARAVGALIDRLLAVGRGDLSSPAPLAVKTEMPALAAAVDGLFDQVRTSLDNFQALAMYDPVTSLPNRIHFRREAERLLSTRDPDEKLALLFVDLDGFKEVNDRLGHAEGDQVLTMVANRLRIVIKAETEAGALGQPLLARLAGDEFTILLPDIGCLREAERIAERARAALSEPFGGAGKTSLMGASIGIALCPEHGSDLTELMKAADTAMYHAKESGRSRVCVYDADLAQAGRERALLEAELAQAIAKRELELVFRPELCLRTGAILAGEALVQWKRDGDEPILLDSFEGLVEETGLAHALADWTLEAAALACARWRASGLSQRLNVPLPPRQVERGDLAERLAGIFAVIGPEPWPVEIEIDQAQLAACSSSVRFQLDALHNRGIGLALRSFGGSGSNLTALAASPTDRVRLDPALIVDIDTSDRSRTVAATLIHLLHELGCAVVAGPIERIEQLEVLRAIGCDSVQGLFRSDPLDEDAFIAWVSAQDCAASLAQVS
jgi:diguanylate cyclase (GGDEF)-like protein